MNQTQSISRLSRQYNPIPETSTKPKNVTYSNRTYSSLNTKEEGELIGHYAPTKNLLTEFKIASLVGASKNHLTNNTPASVITAFIWAISDIKSEALNTSGSYNFEEYKRLTPRMGCLFTADKFADVLIKLVVATEAKPTYKESYILHIKGREDIALCLKRKDDNFSIYLFDGKNVETGYYKYKFSFHDDMQISLKNIAEKILTSTTENLNSEPLDTNNCALYSLDTAQECFDVSVFADPKDKGLLITNSRYAKVDSKYFRNNDGSEINLLEMYDNAPQDCKNKILSNLILNNCSQKVAIITSKILEDNHQLQEQDKKHNLINIADLYLAFTKENTEAVVEFITVIAKSNLTPKDKAEIFINYSTDNIGTNLSGILQAIQTGNNEIAIEYIKAIFDNCSHEVIGEINNLITSHSLLHYAIDCNNLSVFSFYIKSILANTEIIDGNKLLLLLDKAKDGKCTLDTLIANKKHDMAVSYLAEVLNDATLDNQLKLILLTTDKLNYGCRENLTKIASDRNQIDAIFEEVKSVLARTDISASQKIAKLQSKPAPKFWQQLFS